MYEASFSGAFSFKAQQDEPVLLAFPFPAGAIGARNVSLRLRSATGEFIEPDGVIYDLRGVYWSGMAQDPDLIHAEVTFAAKGYDRFVYHLPGVGRTQKIRIDLKVSGVSSVQISRRESLLPTTEDDQLLVWDYENLVSERRSVVVDLPGVMSPVGRVVLLAKLASVAIFLFGAGFWYMCEGWSPGRLDSFRWGHFLLLATTYFMFFVIFAVLMFRYQFSTPVGLGLSAILSLPLLVLHVSKSLGGGRPQLYFALIQILPLAIYTLGLVVNGVYGGDYREYVFMGAVVVAMAYFTLTYGGWAEGRMALSSERDRVFHHRERQTRLGHEIDGLTHYLDKVCASRERIDGDLAQDTDPGRQMLRVTLESVVAEIDPLKKQQQIFATELIDLDKQEDGKRHEVGCEQLLARVRAVHKVEEALKTRLNDAHKQLLGQREDDAKRARELRATLNRDVRQAVKQFTKQCERGESTLVELDIILGSDDPQAPRDLRAAIDHGYSELQVLLPRRAEFTRELDALKDQLNEAQHGEAAHTLRLAAGNAAKRLERLVGALGSDLEKLVADRQTRDTHGDGVSARHCPACGQVAPAGKFCLHCGVPAPEELACGQCGVVQHVPRHLLALWPPAGAMHCTSCGARLNLPTLKSAGPVSVSADPSGDKDGSG